MLITKEKIYSEIRAILKSRASGSYCDLIKELAERLYKSRLIEANKERIQAHGFSVIYHDNRELSKLVHECYCHLLFCGVIVPKDEPPTFDHWDYYEITEFGKVWVNKDGGPYPENLSDYIKYLRDNNNNFDEVVVQYITEALNTFDKKYLFASAVMLGAASERLFYLLVEAICKKTKDAKLESLLLNKRDITVLFERTKVVVQDFIDRKEIPYSIHEESWTFLESILLAIRIQRNNAVHPVASQISQEKLWLCLLAFPHLAKKIYQFIDWFEKNIA